MILMMSAIPIIQQKTPNSNCIHRAVRIIFVAILYHKENTAVFLLRFLFVAVIWNRFAQTQNIYKCLKIRNLPLFFKSPKNS